MLNLSIDLCIRKYFSLFLLHSISLICNYIQMKFEASSNNRNYCFLKKCFKIILCPILLRITIYIYIYIYIYVCVCVCACMCVCVCAYFWVSRIRVQKIARRQLNKEINNNKMSFENSSFGIQRTYPGEFSYKRCISKIHLLVVWEDALWFLWNISLGTVRGCFIVFLIEDSSLNYIFWYGERMFCCISEMHLLIWWDSAL